MWEQTDFEVRQTLTYFAILNYCLILPQKCNSYIYCPLKGVNMIILDWIIKSICKYIACNSCKKWYRFRCTNIGNFILTRKIKSSAVKFYCGLQDCNLKKSFCLYQTNAARMKYTVTFRPKDIDEKNAVEKPEKFLVKNDQSEPTDRNREQDLLISEKLINNENNEVQKDPINNIDDEHEESNVNADASLKLDNEVEHTTKSVHVSDQYYSYSLLEQTGVNIETLNESANCSFPKSGLFEKEIFLKY